MTDPKDVMKAAMAAWAMGDQDPLTGDGSFPMGSDDQPVDLIYK